MAVRWTDRAIVARLEDLVAEGKSDHWLGMQVRLMLEERDRDRRGLGVIDLPDNGD